MANDRIPEFVEFGGAKRCPICNMPFSPSDKPPMQEVLENHIEKQHRPGQKSEDSSQAALRIVRGATENK
jgi:hypothetical protein